MDHIPAGLAPWFREVEAFIFDFDGTLYDTRGLGRRLVLARPWEGSLILAERRTRKGLAGGDYGSAGAYYTEFFARMSRAAGKPAEWLQTWYFDRYIPLMCGVLKKHYRPRPGTAELFEFLRQRDFPIAVYSDYPRTAERLSSLGLDPAVGGRLYGPEHFGAQKPAVRPFVSIARDLGVPPKHILVVGDRDDTDGAGAAAAGMAYINIKSHKKQDPSLSFSWEALIALLRELPNRSPSTNPGF